MNKNPNNHCPKILTAIVTVTFVAVMYVNQQALIYQMGLKVKQNNDVYAKLVDHNKIMVYNVLNLRSPVSLGRKLLAKEVELSMPSKWQVVKIDHSPEKIVLQGKNLANIARTR
ncbi:MAG: hypothetical protein CO035_05575 [Candidatus Omnitrophica bacterium CG_4_9_14_0_2_um_filter_42_8]|nr:MAG: hypothetical protein COW92_02565 [Candidatus Omnitrophica bacterium CG22_combo_CG10-13_8_21_14_all_43_16]PJC47842.1 MAG: hypothetical protein CO035_05575 [Candidatus Omnitrophica bacterium CG_4_9_14_0_2_um_filter_42_8]